MPQEIETEISLLPYNKALAFYSTPVKLLKLAKSVISIPLTKIFNQSALTGVYPAKLKLYAKVIPVFKGEGETLPENYRPISLLSIYTRLFERLLYRRLITFIDKNDILYDLQYGFRNKHSTQHAILDTVNTIHSNIDNRKYSCGIFIDLKKPFDTVNYEILLAKLKNYGMREVINSWFRSYLSDRRQSIEIDKCISETETITCVVLFLLYINDIHKSSK